MDYKDYYAILGVPRSASAADIKKAYRRLAREYHPDVNAGDPSAEQKFKEINEAYTVLSDEKKRHTYDRFGAQWKQYERAGQSFDWSQWFNNAGAPNPGQQQRRTVSPEEFEQMFGGAGGSGSPFSDFFQQLFGGGMAPGRPGQARTSTQQTPFNRRSSAHSVPVEISLEEAFHGTKRTVQQGTARFEVTIPPGVRTGSKVRAGDLIMAVRVKPHPDFTIDGSNLRTKVPVDLYTALLGGEIHVPTLQGTLALVIPPDTQNGKIFRLKGQGMPDPKDNSKQGDLLVELSVTLPVPLSPEAKQRFAAIRKEFPD